VAIRPIFWPQVTVVAQVPSGAVGDGCPGHAARVVVHGDRADTVGGGALFPSSSASGINGTDQLVTEIGEETGMGPRTIVDATIACYAAHLRRIGELSKPSKTDTEQQPKAS
jgi:hypothetical protein